MRNLEIIVFIAVVALVLIQSEGKKYNPCCSYPCKNRGVCVATKNYEGYTCNCEGTGLSYYGKNCEIPTWGQWMSNLFSPNYDTLTYFMTSFKPFWSFVQFLTPLRRRLTSGFILFKTSFVESPPLYATDGLPYTLLDSAKNKSFFARSLPEIPDDCPKPLGTAGKDKLPDIDEIVHKMFKRKEFIPDKIGTSVLLSFFAQHFTHQFFKTDFKSGPGYSLGAQTVDASQIYGSEKQVEDALRSHIDGKMRMQTLNGEEYPPYLKDINLNITFPVGMVPPKDVEVFALGHNLFPAIPGLFLLNTIYLREHNRICDVLKNEHPEWNDERLFQTAKLIVIGVSIKIIVEEYLHSVSNLHLQVEFDPTLIHGKLDDYANRAFVEHNHLYHMHQMMPDEFNIDGTIYPMGKFLFHSDIVVKHGTNKFAESLSKQAAGLVTLQNHGPYLLEMAKRTIEHGREMKLQPYNEYRKRFGPYPLDSIDQMTSNEEHRRLLKELYGDDVNGIEFFVGVMAEERRYKGIFSSTLYEIIGPYSLKAILAAPICSPHYWRASTFGGDVGFDIIKTANLEKLFCGNMPGKCGYVAFRVPGYFSESNVPQKAEPQKTEL